MNLCMNRLAVMIVPWLLAGALAAAAYEVPVADTDYSSQVCSGMWAGKDTFING